MPSARGTVINHKQLKAKHKLLAPAHAEPSRVRLHRAISWLGRAESEAADHDAQFIFLWIAFNAAYAREFGFEKTERDQLGMFIDTLLSIDSGKRLQALVMGQFTGPIRTLIENHFVFEPFWRALRDHDASECWKVQFATGRKTALKSLLGGHTGAVLAIMFDRLYVLRNQLIHGGATWNSAVNRAQVKDGAHLLLALVPIMVELMLDHPELDFGGILYPVI